MLKFPEHTSGDVRSLINQLLVPAPEARIGAGAGARAFAPLKKHPFFSNHNGSNKAVSPRFHHNNGGFNRFVQLTVAKNSYL